MDRRISSEDPEYRLSSKAVAILDIGSAIATLTFHVFTILTQEASEGSDKGSHLHPNSQHSHFRTDVLIPLTPSQLQLHGYVLVLAWISIISVNILQLVIGFTLLSSTSLQIEATRALHGSRTWIKTTILLLILLIFKLVILYFMSEMGTSVSFTTLTCILELVARSIGLVIVMRYLHVVTVAFPDISQIYYEAQQLMEVETPKRNPVTDAVWF